MDKISASLDTSWRKSLAQLAWLMGMSVSSGWNATKLLHMIHTQQLWFIYSITQT